MLHKLKHLYTFGAFTLNASDRVLLHGEREVKLGPTAFDLLHFFVGRPGTLVNREELKLAVWGNEHIVDNNVDQKIAEVRMALLQCEPSAGEYIQNVRGHGWRFVAPVTERSEARLPKEEALPEAVPSPLAPPSVTASAPVVRALPRRWLVPASIAAAAVALGVMIVDSGTGRGAPTPGVLHYDKLTSDGRPKFGPLVTDGRFVYFATLANAEAGVQFAAAVPVLGGDVVSPSAPLAPPFFIWDIARSTGDLLYSRPAGNTWALSVWRQKEREMESGPGDPNARISPDGRSIASVAGHPPTSELIVSDLGPSPNIRKIPIHGVIGLPSWSPDGNRIRFAVQDAVSETSVFWEVRRDGSNLHSLPFHSEPGYAFRAGGWSADALYFIYTENRVDHPNCNLWILSENPALGRGQPMRLTNGPVSFESVALGADSSTVFALGANFNSELARFDSKSREFVTFWKGVPAVDVAFSNDGSRAAYRRLPEDTLWISRADGSEAQQLTQPPLEVYQPHWSPDGSRIAFVGRVPGKPYRIFVISATGGRPEAIKPVDLFDHGVPSWSADGKHLVFGERRQRKPDTEMLIHLLDLTSGAETILPDSRGKWSPRWSPGGRYIVAVTTDFRSLVLFDWQAQRWTTLYSGSGIDDATWSLDGRFVHFRARTEHGQALFRVRVADATIEQLAMYPVSEQDWAGVAPDGSPLVLRSTRIEEIYRLDLKLP